jgi:hypothetical protein
VEIRTVRCTFHSSCLAAATGVSRCLGSVWLTEYADLAQSVLALGHACGMRP